MGETGKIIGAILAILGIIFIPYSMSNERVEDFEFNKTGVSVGNVSICPYYWQERCAFTKIYENSSDCKDDNEYYSTMQLCEGADWHVVINNSNETIWIKYKTGYLSVKKKGWKYFHLKPFY